MSRKKK